jgi:hypothetical protein
VDTPKVDPKTGQKIKSAPYTFFFGDYLPYWPLTFLAILSGPTVVEAISGKIEKTKEHKQK